MRMPTSHRPEGSGSCVPRRAGCRTSLVAGLFVVALLVAATPASADRHHARVFPPGAHPFGQTYGEWAADWWKWALAQPADVNPIVDPTGEHCAQGQRGRIWFLAGTGFDAPSTVSRRCTVPKGTALVFPVLNFVSGWGTSDPPEQRSEEYQRSVATPAMLAATNLSASVDGVAVKRIRRYFEESPVFRVVLPADNVFGIDSSCLPSPMPDAGCVLFPTVDAGYYLVTKRLKRGKHRIHFAGTAGDFSLDVTYRITVAR
jgi:hypothetical protein